MKSFLPVTCKLVLVLLLFFKYYYLITFDRSFLLIIWSSCSLYSEKKDDSQEFIQYLQKKQPSLYTNKTEHTYLVCWNNHLSTQIKQSTHIWYADRNHVFAGYWRSMQYQWVRAKTGWHQVRITCLSVDWLARSQDNMSICELFSQSVSSITIQLSVLL